MEVLIWRQLHHPNIIPLLGIDPKKRLSIVTPWQESGTTNDYLRKLSQKGEKPEFPVLARLILIISR